MPQPLLRFVLSASLTGTLATAQCATAWQQGFGPAGTDLEVYASATFDPDGSGPMPGRLVVGGRFSIAGTTATEGVASLNPATRQWEPLGAGLNGWVFALMTRANGNLVAGGWFNTSGAQILPGIAEWNGATWSPVGTGTTGNVLALCELSNGDLIAGGFFGDIGNNVARWNGTAWTNVGGGVNAPVLALLPEAGTAFVAGGLFGNGIQRWTGNAWQGLGGGVNGPVNALAQLQNGSVVAGGDFTMAGGVPARCVARWNGVTWTALGAGCNDEVKALLVQSNGDLLAGGAFTNAGATFASCVARWNGNVWSDAATIVPTGLATFEPAQGQAWVNTLTAAPDQEVAAGGMFSSVGGIGANNVALLNGLLWRAPNLGTNAPIVMLTALPNGDVVAGGPFRVIDGVAANGIARWDGINWAPFGLGVDDAVRAVVSLPNGDLVAGGRFTTAGGAPASNVARWTGAGWLPLGAGTDADVAALTVLPNGDVVAGGDFLAPAAGLARWNGIAWSAIGGGLTGNGWPARVVAAVTMPNGDLVVAGDFSAAGAVAADNIARWNGTLWSPLGTGLLSHSRTMTTLQNGDLLVGGTLLIASPTQLVTGIARWNGSAWSAFGPATFAGSRLNAVYTFSRLPDGSLAAGGKVFPAVAGNQVARWNGATWSLVAGSTSNWLLLYDDSLALAPTRDGGLMMGGLFTRAGVALSAGLARLTPSCPATVANVGGGCPSSGGNNELAVVTPPWTGAVCRLRSTGVPTSAVVFAVLGFGQIALPLSSVFPQAGPGCVVTASPDAVVFGSSVAGSFEFAFALPNAPALAGIVLYHQQVPFELNALLQVIAVSATNTLRLTVGTF